MADHSRNPADNANLAKLNEKLDQIASSLQRQLAANKAEVESLRAEVRTQSEITSTARQEAKVRAATPKRGAVLPEATPAAVEQAANDAERLAAARRSAAASAQQEAQATARMNRDLLSAAERVRGLQGVGLLQQAGLAGRGATPPAGPAAAAAARVEAASRAEEEARLRALTEANRQAISRAAANRRAPQPIRLDEVARRDAELDARRTAVGAPVGAGEEQIRQRETYLEWTRRAKAGSIDFRREIIAESQAFGLVNNSLTRYGYMTSEFIEAAARGQVTFRQLGQNVAGTIAKFGGWTAAAAAVYGVVGAFHELGAGALDAESGVGLVSRIITNLDTGRLRQSFRDLSGEFNLPIADVAQAVYGASKVYNDQASAVDAARQVLFAMKVGELSAAEATRYLTSIVAGFRLEAAQLPDVFDAINQAQNKFGGNTGQLVAGVAKAAGAFKLAGGSYRELIAIIETGQKLTGASGENVGTAVSRSAGTVLTKQGVARLAEAGLTPGQDYPKLLAQAFREAQGADPERVQEIARSLVPSGGQFARIFVPILQNRELYQKVLREITDHSHGSAERELSRALRQPDEQLKSLVNGVQRLGAAFAQMGAIDAPFIGIVEPLRLALNLATQLTEELSIIPRPIRSAAVGLLEVAAALRLARRFNLGDSLPRGQSGGLYERFRGGEGTFGLTRPRGAQFNAVITKELDETAKVLGADLARARVQVRHALLAETAAVNAAQVAQGTPAELAAGKRLADAHERTLGAQFQAQAVQEELAALELQGVEYQRLRKAGLEAELAAQKAQIGTSTATLARGAGEVERLYPEDLPIDESHVPTDLGVHIAGDVAAEKAAARSAARKAERAAVERVAKTRLESWGAALGTAGAGLYGTVKERLPERLQQRLSTEGREAAAAKAAERGGLSRLTVFGGALIGGAVAVKAMADASHDAERRLREFTSVSGSVEAQQKRIDKEREENFAVGKGGQARGRQYLSDVVNLRPGALVEHLATRLNPFGGLGLKTSDQINADALEARQRELDSLKRAQDRGRLLSTPQVQQRLRGRLASAFGPGAEIAEIQKAIGEIDSGYAAAFGGKKAKQAAQRAKLHFQQQIAQIKAAGGDLDEALRLITGLDDLKAYAADIATKFSLQSNTGNLYGQANVALINARKAAIANPKKAADALGVINSVTASVTEDVQKQLERATKYGPQSARGPARAAAVGRLRSGLVGRLPQQIREYQEQLSQFGDQRRDALAGGNAGRAEQLRVRIGTTRKRLHGLREQLKLSDRAVNEFERDQQRTTYEEASALYDVRTTLQVTRAGNNPVAAARIRLRRINARLKAVAHEYTKDSVEYLNALNDAAQSRQALVDAELDKFNLGIDLNRSRSNIGASDEQRRAGAIADALSKYQHAKKVLPAGDSRIESALKDYYDALGQEVEQARQAAEELDSARRELALSRLDPSDQVGAARVNLAYDRRALATARTPAERIRAQAAINRDIQTQRDARLGAKASTIDYQLAMEQIDNETAAAEYDALARRVRNNKELYRQYRLKAKELRDSANGGDGYALDIANIKLPTPYEVNRAIKEGRRGASAAQHNYNDHRRVTINIRGGDLRRVGRVLETHLGHNGRGRLRARGYK